MEYLKKYHLYLICLLLFFLILVNSYFVFFKKEINKEIIINNSKEEIIVKDEFYVDIKGYIKKPGVYLVNSETLVNDLISMAGGLSKNGATTNLNLSKKLTSEMVIIVNSKQEIEKLTNPVEVKEECVCEPVVINECLIKDSEETLSKININKANTEELMELNGIGASKAEAIIIYRTTNGLFNAIEDIMNVSGIGESAFAKIKEDITV